MFCFHCRWLVSRWLDTHKPLSDRAARHVSQCPDCQNFLTQSKTLALQLQNEAKALKQPGEQPVFNLSVDRAQQTSYRYKYWVIAAGLAALFLVALLVWPSAPRQQSNRVTTSSIHILADDELTQISNWMESPIEQELEGLKASTRSATRFLISCLELGQMRKK